MIPEPKSIELRKRWRLHCSLCELLQGATVPFLIFAKDLIDFLVGQAPANSHPRARIQLAQVSPETELLIEALILLNTRLLGCMRFKECDAHPKQQIICLEVGSVHTCPITIDQLRTHLPCPIANLINCRSELSARASVVSRQP